MTDQLEQQLRVLGVAAQAAVVEHDVVALVGPAPAGLHHDGLGLYEKRPAAKGRINGAPSYSLVGSRDKTVMWRASGGAWLVGSSAEQGGNDGAMRAKQGSGVPGTPDSMVAMWKMHSENGSYIEAPGVRCIAGASIQHEWDTASRHIGLVGTTPGHLQRDCLGLFERTKGELVNGFPTYTVVGTDGNDVLWHAGSCWIVGNRSDLGSKIGGLLAYDGALRPEAVAAPWQVMDLSNQWGAAPLVRVIVGAQLDFELTSAATTIALVGATPQQLHGSFVGVFERLPNRVNGLPTYKSKGSSNVLMWHAGSYWFVGSFTRSAGGQMRAADGAMRPECIAACWEVWDGKAGGGKGAWVEAPELKCLPKHRIVQAVEEVRAVEKKTMARERQLRRTASAIGRLEKQTRRPLAN